MINFKETIDDLTEGIPMAKIAVEFNFSVETLRRVRSGMREPPTEWRQTFKSLAMMRRDELDHLIARLNEE